MQLGEWLLPSGSREEQPRPSSSEGDGGEVEFIRSPSSPSSSSSHHRRAAEEEALCILLLTIHTYKQPISVFAQQLHERYNNSAAREVAYVLLRWAQLHPSHFKQNSILRTLWQKAASDGHLHEFGLKVGGSTASTSAEQMRLIADATGVWAPFMKPPAITRRHEGEVEEVSLMRLSTIEMRQVIGCLSDQPISYQEPSSPLLPSPTTRASSLATLTPTAQLRCCRHTYIPPHLRTQAKPSTRYCNGRALVGD